MVVSKLICSVSVRNTAWCSLWTRPPRPASSHQRLRCSSEVSSLLFLRFGGRMPLFLFIFILYNVRTVHSFNHIHTIHLSIAIRWGLSPFTFYITFYFIFLFLLSARIICERNWAQICKPFKEPRNRFPAWHGPVRQPYLTYRAARLHWLARFLGIDSWAP